MASFYLGNMESNPGLLGLTTSSSYRAFYDALVTHMESTWPLDNAPQLDALAGGSGVYIPPETPVTPPAPTPTQTKQQRTAAELVLAQLGSPVNLAAGRWVSAVDPNSTTHVGAEQYAVDLNMVVDEEDSNPFADRGQPVFAPLTGTVFDLDRDIGRLVLRSAITLSDGSTVQVYILFEHLKIDASLSVGNVFARGRKVGTIDLLTDGTTQGNGHVHIRPHLHWSVHLGSVNAASIDLNGWLTRNGITTLEDPEGTDTGGISQLAFDNAHSYAPGEEFWIDIDFQVDRLGPYRIEIASLGDWIVSGRTTFTLVRPDGTSTIPTIRSEVDTRVLTFSAPIRGTYHLRINRLVSPSVLNNFESACWNDVSITVIREIGGTTSNGTSGSAFAVGSETIKIDNRLLYALDGSVNLWNWGNGPLNPNEPIWLVIHGKDSQFNREERNNMTELADALLATGDQVLVLDWRDYAADGGERDVIGGQWIPGIAAWAAQRLADLHIPAHRLRIAAHSWGTFVGYELARTMSVEHAQVRAFVALDSASNLRDIPIIGNPYHDSRVRFDAVSQNSWAFEGSALAVDARSATARHTVKVDVINAGIGPEGQKLRHSLVVDAFTDLIRRDTAISERFGLDTLINPNPVEDKPWTRDGLSDFGYKGYEAILYATYQETNVTDVYTVRGQSLQYIDRNGHLVHVTPDAAPQIDVGGDSFASPVNLGILASARDLDGWVGGLNYQDVYRFTLTSARDVVLGGVSAGLFVELYFVTPGGGRVPLNPGQQDESGRLYELGAGTYDLKLSTAAADLIYALRLF
ncbi:MAG: hypothetical protein IT428_05900 [Planctomycetaceae bacterium]|nr:hypothetical protein [Planctomycetaceae bacterium]